MSPVRNQNYVPHVIPMLYGEKTEGKKTACILTWTKGSGIGVSTNWKSWCLWLGGFHKAQTTNFHKQVNYMNRFVVTAHPEYLWRYLNAFGAYFHSCRLTWKWAQKAFRCLQSSLLAMLPDPEVSSKGLQHSLPELSWIGPTQRWFKCLHSGPQNPFMNGTNLHVKYRDSWTVCKLGVYINRVKWTTKQAGWSKM